ncbi:MAG: UDP-2,3-diacylglucosamine diphosphatase [Sulfurospirillaceae bacterium]|nr:UDP-2,3-diacylglucosamine diphosphatase [Sulfurospirillaceae bacterium]
MFLDVKEGAIFISDAHENDNRDYFWQFLLAVESKKIEATQLFLMGDMFDLLVGEVKYLRKKYQRYIDLLEKIALEIEVFYFEGNHDFVLEKIFKNVKLYKIEEQPVLFSIDEKKLLLLHGDKYGGQRHMLYTSIIRNKTVLKTLNFFDSISRNYISKKILNKLLKKNICTEIDAFEHIIRAKIKKFINIDTDIIAEGHYHQNKNFNVNNIKYINFPSFACNQSYFIVQFSSNMKFVENKLRGFDV